MKKKMMTALCALVLTMGATSSSFVTEGSVQST